MEKVSEKITFIALFFTMMSILSSAYPLVLIFSYVIHEIGHMAFAKIARVRVRRARIGPFQIRLAYDCTGVSYKSELLVCSGGVIFNLIFAIILVPLLGMSELLNFFFICNLSIALMNLYPVSTLDGGQMLKSLLMIVFDFECALKTWKVISFIFAFLLWLCAVYLLLVFDSSASMFFISVFLLVELCFLNE